MSGFVKRGLSSIDLTGFWTREVGSVLTGKLVKHVPNDKDPKHIRPFFIFAAEESQAVMNVDGAKDSVPVSPGDYVGVAANWALTSQIDAVKDIGKRIRMTVDGKRENSRGGVPMTLITVEVDEG